MYINWHGSLDSLQLKLVESFFPTEKLMYRTWSWYVLDVKWYRIESKYGLKLDKKKKFFFNFIKLDKKNNQEPVNQIDLWFCFTA